MESKYQIPEQALADFSRGTGCESYKFLGAHLITMSGQVGSVLLAEGGALAGLFG